MQCRVELRRLLEFGPRTFDYGHNHSNRQTQHESTVDHQEDATELASLQSSIRKRNLKVE